MDTPPTSPACISLAKPALLLQVRLRVGFAANKAFGCLAAWLRKPGPCGRAESTCKRLLHNSGFQGLHRRKIMSLCDECDMSATALALFLSTVTPPAVVAASDRRPHRGRAAGEVAGGPAKPDGERGWARRDEPRHVQHNRGPSNTIRFENARNPLAATLRSHAVVRDASNHVPSDGTFRVGAICRRANAIEGRRAVVRGRGLIEHSGNEAKRRAMQIMKKRVRGATSPWACIAHPAMEPMRRRPKQQSTRCGDGARRGQTHTISALRRAICAPSISGESGSDDWEKAGPCV